MKVKKSVKKVAAKKATAKKAEKKTTAKKVSSRISKSGKFTSIRNLMESLFAKNKEVKFEECLKIVGKEYPASKFNKQHYGWYRTQIISYDGHKPKAKAKKVDTKAKTKTAAKKVAKKVKKVRKAK